jgi:small-conductance mechanosensitive channel
MNAPAFALPVTSLQNWLAALLHLSSLIEIAVLLLCVMLTWVLLRWARRSVDAPPSSILFGRRVVDGVLFPLLLLCQTGLAKALLGGTLQPVVLRVAMPVVLSLFLIRLAVQVLQAAFSNAPLVRLLERTLSWLVWLLLALWFSGFLPLILEELDQIHWKVGNSNMSVRTMLEGGLTASVVLILTLWVSSAIEAKLLYAATGSDLSLRKAISNALRALLSFVGLLLALSAVGIDLTALSVLGGAVGVGIGLGLQKLAANYVSGFVILTERSMRIGDNVRVDNFEGRITDINARYTVIRSLGGRESIVPNEMLITNRIENLSLADTKVVQTTTVSVGYASDVALVQRLLLEAATAQTRVLTEPAPFVALSEFGADGLEFTLGYWMSDPENGQINLRSQVNLAVLAAFRAHGIEIPYPQRVVHSVPG